MGTEWEISGGKPALKSAIDFKMHLLTKGYNGVDLCLDKTHKLFAIVCRDNEKISYLKETDPRQYGALNLWAYAIGDENNSIGQLQSEHKMAKYIEWVSTTDSRRGIGVGKLLVSRAIEKLKNKKSIIDPIFLEAIDEYAGHFHQFGFDSYMQGSNPEYDRNLKKMKSEANMILTRDRFYLAQAQSFVKDKHEIFAPQLVTKR